MTNAFDLIGTIGAKTCALASHATEALISLPACSTRTETWNMGVIVLALVGFALGVAAARAHSKRRVY